MKRIAPCLISLCAVAVVLAAPAQDRFFDADGVRPRYVESGAGETLLLVHGLTSSLEGNWLATGWLADWLSPDGKSPHLALAAALTAGGLAAVGLFALGFKSYRKSNETLAATAAVPA
ncbi:MAG: hypothetical protein FJ387_30070 [Verrucomicrobia bacterium]|nr:hypothetical protein [Verrucomicrobiota bacterium]